MEIMAIEYEFKEAKQPEFPPRNLIGIKSGDETFEVSADAFGTNSYKGNIEEMSKKYSHPQTGETISFRPATTRKSILTASYKFPERAKPQIFNPRWLQAGRIVRTSEGVFANVPLDENGNPIFDEKILTSYLNGVEPKTVGKGKVYLVPNNRTLEDFGFADYKSFTRDIQDCGDFVNGGLAKVLEHNERAEALEEISSAKNYPRGVNVWGFDSVSKPTLKVASLDSGRGSGGGLYVDGGWGGVDDDGGGFAFGVRNASDPQSRSPQKIKKFY